MNGTRAVILAGGKGTRLSPYTAVLPKPLMPFGDRPILDYVIRQLRDSGITDIVLSVGYLAPLLETYFGDGSQRDVRMSYVREDRPLGTAGPLALLRGDAPLLVLNGDVLTDLDYRRLVDHHLSTDAEVTLTLASLDTQIGYGVIQTTDDGRVVAYEEKPTLRHQISMGIYVVRATALDLIADGEHIDFPDFTRRVLEAGRVVRGYTHSGFWLDIGRREDYEAASRDPDAILNKLFPASDKP